MKALSVQQPYTYAICHGGKDVENRTWSHSHRGSTLMHAGKKELVDDVDGVLRMIAKHHNTTLATVERHYRANRHLGGFVGITRITDCVADHKSQWFVGPRAFVLEGSRPLPFVAWRGERGFFDVDAMVDFRAGSNELELRITAAARAPADAGLL